MPEQKMMKSTNELGMTIDITTRMAMFAMAKSFTDDQLSVLFGVIEIELDRAYGEQARDYIDTYRRSVFNLRNEFDKVKQ